MDIDEIGDIIETAQDGTFPEKVMNLNNHKDVLRTIPSLEFEVELRSHSLSEIKKEIAEGHRPTIAWVELSDDRHTRRAAHAVVITGFEDEKQLIYYNDPMFGEKEEDMASFVTRWENADRVLIKVKIGMKEQRILDEYVEKEANSNQVIEGKILECN